MPRAPRLSASSQGLTSTVFDDLRARAARGRVHALHVGDTWREPCEAARCEALATSEHPRVHQYAPPHGEGALLEALERILTAQAGERIGRERIQVVAGATGGLSVACQALLDPGDEVIIPTPCWPLIPGIVRSRGAVAVEAPIMTRVGEPGFDMEAELEARVTPRTAALYLNTPHNPTGVILDDAQLAGVARVAARHDLWVLCDEVYQEIWLGARRPSPAWARADLREHSIATHSVSKSHGLAGIRVGWLHGPPAAIAAIRAVFTHQVYGAARPMQHLALRALNSGETWLAETRALYRDAARKAADVFGLSVPEAGTFLFFDARAFGGGADDALPFLERCVDEGVLLTPGLACGRDFGAWVRLCFTSVPPDELDAALVGLRRVVGGGA
jgi:N-succinyldiaminopimelate aminotransferase